ncbi:MAG: hypothetical protein K8F51_04370 [Comamonas sp.]|nr:hypothetical protein [Comamonas sp.]
MFVIIAVTLSVMTGCASVPSYYRETCAEIASFANSVDSSVRSVTLTTDWGGRFTPQPADRYILASKECDHGDYGPGRELCDYLLQNTSTEFASANLNTVLVCLGVARPARMVTDTEFVQTKLWSYVAAGVRTDVRVGVEFAAETKQSPPKLKIIAEHYP